MRKIQDSPIRELDAAAVPLHKPNAEKSLERTNLLSYRAERDAKFIGGRRNAATSADGLENLNRTQWG
jgi:hypothetical protein